MRSFARARGAAVFGAHAGLVDVQVSVVEQDESAPRPFRIVGLPDGAVREGRERIFAAIVHGGWRWPWGPVTANLAPAAARKEGAALDLPIALGVLVGAGAFEPATPLDECLALGELALDGTLRSVRGALAAVEAARREGVPRALVPRANAAEAAAVAGVEVVAAASLAEAVGHLSGKRSLPVEARPTWRPAPVDARLAVRGQPGAVHAARIAATGGHNLLLWGPPGAGKTLLARQIRSWLPALSYAEAVEVSRIHSLAGLLESGLVTERPFRAPHHTTTLAGLVGGGPHPRPGEVSLAHLGVLFLDELAEFRRESLEALRQPLEDGRYVLGRVAGRVTFPAEVLLVAASNPCPCGWHGETTRRCRCSRRDVARYHARISGPLRDRFDLEVRVRSVDPEHLVGEAQPSDVLAGLEVARGAQAARAKRLGLARPLNARIPARLLPRAVVPTREAERLLVRQARALGWTGRGVHRVLRVARTIADLAGSERVEEAHVLEASGLRQG